MEDLRGPGGLCPAGLARHRHEGSKGAARSAAVADARAQLGAFRPGVYAIHVRTTGEGDCARR
jgi:hypothetical protein